MSREKTKIISIVGPTASGKSDFAVLLARHINGEVISTDSRQVYKGLDIGTGKITKKEMCGVPHHLIDICSPKKVFTVFDFKEQADKKIREIVGRGKVPILCGGTGFYNDAVVKNITLPEVLPNKKLRLTLSKKTLSFLQKTLKRLDSIRYENIDIQNPVRLIRAIEIAQALGKVPQISPSPQYDVLTIGIKPNDEILKRKIHDRLIARMKKGMVNEIKNLHKDGLSWKRMDELGLEYRYTSLFLRDKLSKAEMIAKLESEIWHYAKRQMTWFKANDSTEWIESNKDKKIIAYTMRWLTKREK